MKQRLIELLSNMKKYNRGIMSKEIYGLEPEVCYDALVVAPGWKPTKIITDPSYGVSVLTEHSYISGYLVEKDGLKIAWIQTASGANNLLDHLLVCAELSFRKMIFVGAVGSLVPEYEVGDFCTPEYSISGSAALSYLEERISENTMFQKICPDRAYVDSVVKLAKEKGYELRRAPVFCTDSISLEYSHLDEIKATGAKLIEMETAAFYKLAEMFEVPSVALLVVSDNSASGKPLLGRGETLDQKYSFSRSTVIPEMICAISRQEFGG